MNASDVLRYGDRTLLSILEVVPMSNWEEGGVCGVWSVREILAHLASFEQALVGLLGTFLGEEEPLVTREIIEMDGDEFNAVQVAARAGRAPIEVLGEYSGAHRRVMELVARIPEETLRRPGTLPWYGVEYALDDFIVYSYYGHKREHSAQVAVFKDRLDARSGSAISITGSKK